MQRPLPRLRQKQRGISLFIVIVIVMLSMLLALWSSRTSLFNEIMVGNDADYQRAFEAAQALIQDAEFDIRGSKPDGTACMPITGKPDICRVSHAATTVWFPNEDKELGPLFVTLDAAPSKCIKGMCLKRIGSQDFWNDKTTLDKLIEANVGARYGQFTGATTGIAGSTGSNPILKKTGLGEGAWYWVEVMPYDSKSGNSGLISGLDSSNLVLNLTPSVAYRITAIARGLKPSTQVVLQSTFVRQKLKD